jgi:hypothetical protein
VSTKTWPACPASLALVAAIALQIAFGPPAVPLATTLGVAAARIFVTRHSLDPPAASALAATNSSSPAAPGASAAATGPMLVDDPAGSVALPTTVRFDARSCHTLVGVQLPCATK